MSHQRSIINNLETCNLFTPWTNPENQVKSYILNNTQTPFSQSFYFVNDSWNSDGDYLWFYTRCPPSGHMLGVADIKNGKIHIHPETEFIDASPFINPVDNKAYWFQDYSLWRRSPEPEAEIEHVMQFPESITKSLSPKRIATHITLRADRKAINFDAEFGTNWLAGDIDLESGKLSVWQTFNKCYNHAQFSPTDNDVMLINQDGWIHPATGEHTDYTHRMWLLHRNGDLRPIINTPTPKHGHEWWDPDGEHVWVVYYGVGILKININTSKTTNVCPGEYSHGHSDKTGRYIITDRNLHLNPPKCEVDFHDTHTGKRVSLINSTWQGDNRLLKYHIHPHPRFSLNDQVITYTTWCNNKVDIAVTPVAELINKLNT